MIEQYLSNTNESVTMFILQKKKNKIKLNKAKERDRKVGQLYDHRCGISDFD